MGDKCCVIILEDSFAEISDIKDRDIRISGKKRIYSFFMRSRWFVRKVRKEVAGFVVSLGKSEGSGTGRVYYNVIWRIHKGEGLVSDLAKDETPTMALPTTSIAASQFVSSGKELLDSSFYP